MTLTETTNELPPPMVLSLDAPWRELWVFDEVDSTQSLASERVQAGLDLHGIAVVAERQLLGRGRSGNVWSSEPGGLYVTAGLPGGRPIPLPYTGWLPLAAALACAAVLKSQFGIVAQVKWPNDVLINGAKVAGLLGEVARAGKSNEAATMLIGMGLNWRNTVPPTVQPRFTVTSLMEHYPELTDAGRIKFLADWLMLLGDWHERVAEHTVTALKDLRRAAERILWRIGEQVVLERTEQGQVAGKLMGLNELGGALLRTDEGKILNVHCGWQSAHGATAQN